MDNILKYILEDTKQIALEFKQSVDRLAGQKKEELQENKTELEKMRASGVYSSEYINNYRFDEKRPYKECFRRSVELKKPRLEHNIERIKQYVLDYFNAPLNADLSNKLAMFKQLGVKPTTKELQMLEKTATTYSDKRIFGQYAQEVGYNYATVPDVDRISNALNNYVASAMRVLNYGGSDAELIEYIDAYENPADAINKALCSSADSFITRDETSTFIKFLEDTGIDLKVEPLSDQELELIEELVQSEKYPYSLERNVKQYAENSVIRDLLLRHDEYRKYLL